MIQLLSKKLTNYLCSKQVIDNSKYDIYEYGYEVFFSGMLGFIIVLAIGLISGHFLQSLLFLITFVPLRQRCGGYHAGSYLKCNIIFTFVFISVISVSYAIQNFSLIYKLIILMLSFATIIEYAPIENPNKPMSDAEKSKNKKISIIISAVIFTVSVVLNFFYPVFSTTIMCTFLSVAMLMIVEHFKSEDDLGDC